MAEKIKITKRAVDALKPREARYEVWDTEISGFAVRVSPADRKTYLFKYRVGGGRAGRIRWGTIGAHGALTPDQARAIARRWAAEVAEGGDPAGDKRTKREGETVADLMDWYLTDHVAQHNKPKTEQEVRALVKRLILPALGKLKVADLNGADVSRLHNSLSSTPTQANRCLSALSKACTLAEKPWGLRPKGSNPCSGIKRFKERKVKRFLSPSEFARLGSVLADAEAGPLRVTLDGRETLRRINPQAVTAIRLLVLTGARVGEILGLRWEHVKAEEGWALLPDSKTGEKALPLSAPALEVLAGLDCPEDGKGFVIRGGRLAAGQNELDPEIPLANIKDSWGLIRTAAGLGDVRLHDLRHSFASVGVAGGMNLPLIGAILGHKETRTTAGYAHLMDDAQRAAANAIGNRIADQLSPPEGGGEVVPLRPKR